MRADSPSGDPTPKASIVISTIRLGGLDVTWEMLKAQTERDFELILVDYWWEKRREIVQERWSEVGLPPERLVHVPPRLGRWAPGHDSGQAYNTGFALARAPLICIAGDYWWGYPRYVEQHLAVFQATQGAATITGHYRKRMPPLATDPHGLWSVFAVPYKHDAGDDSVLFTMSSYRQAITDNFTPGWPWPGLFMLEPTSVNFTQNDSIPRAAMYGVNGLDEVFSGLGGYSDTDIAVRLTEYGHYWVIPGECGVAEELDHRALPAHLAAPRGESPPGALELMEARQAARKSGKLSYIAENGGFTLRAPLTTQDVIRSYESYRPPEVAL